MTSLFGSERSANGIFPFPSASILSMNAWLCSALSRLIA
jgi:hypothetical protein